MEHQLKRFEKIVSYILLCAGMLFVSFQVLEMIWEIGQAFIKRFQDGVGINYEPSYFKNVAVLFFNILLLLEILETVKVFDKSHEIKVKVILIVCLIAVSRKVLLMDASHSEPIAELSVAALILAFSVSYYFVNKKEKRDSSQ